MKPTAKKKVEDMKPAAKKKVNDIVQNPYMSMSKKLLQGELVNRGLKKSGNKNELIARLIAYDKCSGGEDDNDLSTGDINDFDMFDLDFDDTMLSCPDDTYNSLDSVKEMIDFDENLDAWLV